MKKSFFAILLACASLSIAYASPYSYNKASEGFYVAGNFALGMATDPDVSASGLGSGETDSDMGFGTAIAAGYEMGNFRIELEYSHRFNNGKIETPTIAGAAGLGGRESDFRFNSFMLNAYYDFYLTNDVYWYNGGGIGFSRVKFKTNTGNDNDTALAWQLMTGIGVDLTENIAMTLGYRVFTTKNPDFNIAGVDVQAETPFINNIELGVRYNF